MRWLSWVALAALVGCGGSAYSYDQSGGGDAPAAVQTAGGYGGAPAMELDEEVAYASADSGGDFGGDWDDADFEAEEPAPAAPPAERAEVEMRTAIDSARAMRVTHAQRERIAQATGQPQQQGNQAGQSAQPQATDAVDTTGPLLIYTAELTLAVYEVTETQDAILGAVRELNGFLAERSDHHLVVRVPAEKFEDAMTEVEGKGDVLHRNVSVQDVSEEFRDVAIRIRNAEVMRDRLEGLLQRADDVEAALAIERELQRLTDLIERLKGRQRFLADRIAFSTITIHFSSRATETAPDEFRLPFDWLGQLGISNLLTLR